MKVAVIGCAGRMGQMLVRTVADDPACRLIGGSVEPGAPEEGADLGTLAGIAALGVAATADALPLFAAADVAVEFTVPAATVEHAALAAQARCAHVVGTTGLSDEQEAALERAARHTAVMYAPNMSIGVTLMMALTRQVAATLGDDWDIEVLEMHHARKVDAPSGTALGLGRAAAAGRGVALDGVRQSVRDGHTGPRRRGDIGFATLRGGTVAGEHTVIFAGADERFTLGHIATDRRIFARGAIHAAKWAARQRPGLYTMHDVLGLDA
ncbi:MAG: 4-hydroxy-tetrahydrodipicolinate reductase [Alphaproteobacteria bacterium]